MKEATAPDTQTEQRETNEVLDIRKVIEYYLPYLVLAGDYALNIQSKVHSAEHKEGGATSFSQALTDADLSVQNLFEVATLAKFPKVSFDPEEADKSINLKYFRANADTLFTLDPINGTLFYKDGLPIFDIIFTVLEKGRIVGAVTYIPAKGQFYIGVKDQGAFKTTKEELQTGQPWQKHTLEPHSNKVLTYRCSQEILDALKKVIDVKDLHEYDPANWDLAIYSILSGDTDAFVKTKAQIIDWGAIAFIVEQAGGVMSDAEGKPIPNFLDFPDKRIPNIVAAANKEIHKRLIDALSTPFSLEPR